MEHFTTLMLKYNFGHRCYSKLVRDAITNISFHNHHKVSENTSINTLSILLA